MKTFRVSAKMNSTKRGTYHITERCHHCGGVIKEHHDGWHRKGNHYCCYLCYKDDHTGAPATINVIDRKHK